MLEAFVYPVSAVMKFWHWLLASVVGMDNSTSWVWSVVLLVVTIRTFLVPFTWTVYKSGRVAMLLRPEKTEITERYAEATTAEEAKQEKDELKDLYKTYGYNPLVGCVPPLVQIPMILGLYRLLMWLSVPRPEHEHGIGLLGPDEIRSFREATFLGVPLPAYLNMPAEQLAQLGTTVSDVRAVGIPMLATAIVFTTMNMLLSVARTRTQVDWSITSSRVLYKLILRLSLIMPVILLLVGLFGPIPIALLMYWVGNNFWTTSQTAILWLRLVRKFPVDDTHREHNAAKREAAQAELRAAKERKRSRRKRRFRALFRPTTIGSVHRELAAEKEAEVAAKKEEKARKKALNKEKQAALTEARKQEFIERRKARLEAKRAAQQKEESPGKD